MLFHDVILAGRWRGDFLAAPWISVIDVVIKPSPSTPHSPTFHTLIKLHLVFKYFSALLYQSLAEPSNLIYRLSSGVTHPADQGR